tara:strand:+ start:355 stop:1254 length:900 start_codon:yes stop_codon:yes gene_type:complete
VFSEEKDKNIEENSSTEESLEQESSAEESPAEEAPAKEAAEEATTDEVAVEAPVEETKEEAPTDDVATEPSADESTEESPADEAELEEKEIEPQLFDFIIGKKLGMTSIFLENGISIPCTIIEAGPCKITQIKTSDKDGYSALQVGYGIKKNPTKSDQGHFSKANLKDSLKVLKEFKTDENSQNLLGSEISVNSFNEGEYVTVTGKSKGKGFAGHMKRHNFGGGRASHGKNSVMRKAGSVGAGTWPGRVWPGTRMAGRMGGDKVTVENLKVVKVDNDKNLLFVKGAVPGPSKSIVYIEK